MRGKRAGMVDEVAVDRLGAEHERSGLEVARTGDPDVQDGVGPLLRERAGGRGGRLDRADAAAQRLRALDERRARAEWRRRRARSGR